MLENTPENSNRADNNDAQVINNRYVVLNVIGKGGMGIVYRAEDRHTQRTVAVKVIRPDLINEDTTRDRFKREIKVQSSLSHRHILGIHDMGESDGQLYYVMPYINGRSLHRF